MAVKIRLARRGRKNRPFYSIVACDSRMAHTTHFLQKTTKSALFLTKSASSTG